MLRKSMEHFCQDNIEIHFRTFSLKLYALQVVLFFSGEKVITKATSVVHGKIGGIPIPFPLDNPNGCKDSGLKCPMKNGDDGQYKTAIFVKSAYPKVSQLSS